MVPHPAVLGSRSDTAKALIMWKRWESLRGGDPLDLRLHPVAQHRWAVSGAIV
ncbi:MAG: hypothetical protein ACREV7_20830 [Steroidobacteraceae bacterium]